MSSFIHTLTIESADFLALLCTQLDDCYYPCETDEEKYETEEEMEADEEYFTMHGDLTVDTLKVNYTSNGYTYTADDILRRFLAVAFFETPEPDEDGEDSDTWAAYEDLYAQAKEMMHSGKCMVRFKLDVYTSYFDAVCDTEQLSGFGDEFRFLEDYYNDGNSFTVFAAKIQSAELAGILKEYCAAGCEKKDGCYSVPSDDYTGAVRFEGDTVYCASFYRSVNRMLAEIGDAADQALEAAPYAEFFEGHWESSDDCDW